MLTPTQDLQLQLLPHASFNQFNGEQVEADLRANTELWQAATMHNEDVQTLLAELPYGSWAATLLYIASSGADDARLGALAREWRADSAEWQDYPGWARVLVLWWD